jgi:hypothetical protein
MYSSLNHWRHSYDRLICSTQRAYRDHFKVEGPGTEQRSVGSQSKRIYPWFTGLDSLLDAQTEHLRDVIELAASTAALPSGAVGNGPSPNPTESDAVARTASPSSPSANAVLPSLSADDLAMFCSQRTPPELLAEAHVDRVTDSVARTVYGVFLFEHPTADMSGIVFPYFSPVTGRRTTARVRRDHAEMVDGKRKKKYVSGYGDPRHLYFGAWCCGKVARSERGHCARGE